LIKDPDSAKRRVIETREREISPVWPFVFLCFERAALDAIRGWKWKPATRDGAPMAVRITVQMTFKQIR
jgi:hypothetical protein